MCAGTVLLREKLQWSTWNIDHDSKVWTQLEINAEVCPKVCLSVYYRNTSNVLLLCCVILFYFVLQWWGYSIMLPLAKGVKSSHDRKRNGLNFEETKLCFELSSKSIRVHEKTNKKVKQMQDRQKEEGSSDCVFIWLLWGCRWGQIRDIVDHVKIVGFSETYLGLSGKYLGLQHLHAHIFEHIFKQIL